MLDKESNKRWIYTLGISFVILNALGIYYEFFLLSVIPPILLFILALFLSMDKLLLTVVFLVPLSVPLSTFISGLPIDMFLPTEPMLAGMLLVFVLKLIYEGNFDRKILIHPVTISIYFYLTWMLFTTITSTMPLVSIKFLVSKLWFLAAFYFIATQLFRDKKNMSRYSSLYTYSLVIVVFYALYRHVTYGIFDEKVAHWASNPFYKDHTSYGAILAFLIPSTVANITNNRHNIRKVLIYGFILTVLTVGLIFSYSRAAWISLLAGIGVWVIIRFKIKTWVIMSISFIAIVFAVLLGPGILRDMKSNKQDSSTTSISKHIKSITNVSTDASNLERINRWHCALAMFKEKPVVGWGPGTYMFQYAPFQLAKDKTIISTNMGTGGNAHSEYLGPLAEQGVPGTVFYIVIIISTLITGMRVIKKLKDSNIKNIAIASIIGLITYYLHGFLNNFLDTDKLSAPFWGFTALLVAIDVYYINSEDSEKSKIQKVKND